MDALIGVILLVLSLAFLIYIFFWSRRIINFIHDNKLNSAREILKKLHERR